MKKLEDIPKKEVFQTPDKYFDTLPGILQSRLAKKESQWIWSIGKPALRFAIPVLAVAVGIALYLFSIKQESPEQLLASVSDADIEAYLVESDITTEDLIDHIDFNQVETDSLEFENPLLELDDEDADKLLNDIEFEL